MFTRLIVYSTQSTYHVGVPISSVVEHIYIYAIYMLYIYLSHTKNDIAGQKTISRDISFLCHRVIARIKAQVCDK